MYGTRKWKWKYHRFFISNYLGWLLSDSDPRHSISSFIFYLCKLLWLLRRHVHNRILQLVMLRMLFLRILSDVISIGERISTRLNVFVERFHTHADCIENGYHEPNWLFSHFPKYQVIALRIMYVFLAIFFLPRPSLRKLPINFEHRRQTLHGEIMKSEWSQILVLLINKLYFVW